MRQTRNVIPFAIYTLNEFKTTDDVTDAIVDDVIDVRVDTP